MNTNEDQFPQPARPHSINRSTNMKMTHGTAELNVNASASTLHVPGAEPLSKTNPMTMTAKGKARDVGALLRHIKSNNPKTN
jgi:hypothetical protein